MGSEKLGLEVSAAKAGLAAVTPRALKGESGAEHRFDLLFSDGSRFYAFDIRKKVSDLAVVSAYAKKLDTGASVALVCPSEGVTDLARQLALSYGIEILPPQAAGAHLALARTASG